MKLRGPRKDLTGKVKGCGCWADGRRARLRMSNWIASGNKAMPTYCDDEPCVGADVALKEEW